MPNAGTTSPATANAMGEASPGSTALHCEACGGVLGFAVAYCPFCGVARRTARPAIVAAPIPPRAMPPFVAVPPASIATSATVVPHAAALPPVQAAPVPAPAKSNKPAPRPKPADPPRARGRKPGRLRWVAALLAVLAIQQWWSRDDRAAARSSLTVRVYPDQPGSIDVDGVPAGQPGERVFVPPGPHTVTFLSAEWQAAPRQVFAKPGQASDVTFRLQRKQRRLPPIPGPPPRPSARVAAGPDPWAGVAAYGWTTIADIAGTARRCGVQTSINGGRLLLYGGSEKPTTLRLLLHKGLWTIPDLAVPVVIAFDGGPNFSLDARGNGPDIAADIADSDVRDFIHHFTADKRAVLTLPNGREPPWTLDLRGTSPTITAMAKCLEAAELWLPAPFTQPGGQVRPP